MTEQPQNSRAIASGWIDRYKLLEIVGEGGFGTVWMAEQQEPVRRSVALKVLKLGMDSRQVVARFEAERQALALMDHPNIARVFDGGATESGRPFFVMELVRGVPITDFCDAHRMNTRERLIADGVTHRQMVLPPTCSGTWRTNPSAPVRPVHFTNSRN